MTLMSVMEFSATTVLINDLKSLTYMNTFSNRNLLPLAYFTTRENVKCKNVNR